MRHLAHAWLAGADPDVLLGNLRADFWRGAAPARRPGAVGAGLRLHRRIDAVTDAHPAVRALRARFADGLRRRAGVALDVWFDHCLARDLARHTGGTLRDFADRARAALAGDRSAYPPAFAVLVARLRGGDGLCVYADRVRLDAIFERLAARSCRADPLATMPARLDDLDAELARGFAVPWSDRVPLARAERAPGRALKSLPQASSGRSRPQAAATSSTRVATKPIRKPGPRRSASRR